MLLKNENKLLEHLSTPMYQISTESLITISLCLFDKFSSAPFLFDEVYLHTFRIYRIYRVSHLPKSVKNKICNVFEDGISTKRRK